MAFRDLQNSPGFQGSETSSAEITIYTQRGDPVIFVGAQQERPRRITPDGRRSADPNPSLIALSTNKTLGAPSGSWSASLKPSRVAENLFNQILDDDWVDVVFTRHGRKWHTMRGLVDDMRETKVVSGSGATSTVFQITGRDFGKIYETTPIWFSVFTDDPVVGGVALKVFGGVPNVQGSPFNVVKGYLEGFLGELSNAGRAVWKLPEGMPGISGTFVENVVFEPAKGGDLPDRIAINPNYMLPNGTAWSLAQEWSDPTFQELFVDTLPTQFLEERQSDPDNGVPIEDTDMTVVFRERPLVNLDKGKDSPWFNLPLHIIPRQAIRQASVGRSGLERFNAFFVAPQIAQELLGAGAIDLNAPLWNPDDILRHGMRRYDVLTKYTSPNADIIGLSSALRRRIRDWYCLNPYFLNGTLELGLGLPNVHVGERVRIPGATSPDQDETYYVESVANTWSLQPGLKTTLGVTRGWRGTDDSLLEALNRIAFEYTIAVASNPDQVPAAIPTGELVA